MNRRLNRLAFVVLLLGLLVATSTVHAADDDPVQARDKVVSEVVRMLEADVAEDVILAWIDQQDRASGKLVPDDLIALAAAGASPELTRALMQTAEPPAPAHARLPAPRPAPATGVKPETTDDVPLEISLHYRPDRDPEADEDEHWHLFVYLDGRPVLASDGTNWLSQSKRIREATLALERGNHTLRLVQERHARRGQAWRHDARVCPDSLEFDLEGGHARVAIEIKESIGLAFGSKATLEWSIDRGSGPLGASLSAPPTKWPPLCDEIEVNYPDTDKMPRRARKQLAGCVRWNDLWPEASPAPDRATVRNELADTGFRPGSVGEPGRGRR